MRVFYIIPISLIAMLVACNEHDSYKKASEYLKDNEELISCKSDYNTPNHILFYKSNKTINNIDVPDSIRDSFSSYKIIDVLGQRHFINSNEFDNYICSIVQKDL